MVNGDNPRLSKLPLKYFTSTIFSLIVLTQVSGILIAGRGVVAGSFGIRSMTQDGIGLHISPGKAIELFPEGEGEIEFHFQLFHFRYAVSSEFTDSDPVFCVGQDIWFGE
jgi:hypothetical protein